MAKKNLIDELTAGRRLRLVMEGDPRAAQTEAPRAPRPLDYVAPRIAVDPQRRRILERAMKRQETIDALEHGGLAKGFA